jgi:hypothetical protein
VKHPRRALQPNPEKRRHTLSKSLKSVKPLLAVVAASLCTGVGSPAALSAETCANEQLRVENSSTALPDCRAYELASAGSNEAAVFEDEAAAVNADGTQIVYGALDAPLEAQSGEALFNRIRATRDPATGWSDVSIAPPVPSPVTGYFSFQSRGVSADLSSTFEISNQPLTADAASGFNLFIGHADGTYRLLSPLTVTGVNSLFVTGNADFSHVYFRPEVAQLSDDPLAEGNTYSWSESDGLHLVGVLPDGTPAPNGAVLPEFIIRPISEDASRAVFVAGGKMYLRIEDQHTVEVSGTQRTVDPDPNPGPGLAIIAPYNSGRFLGGITADASKVLFVAHSELTNDANTGSSGGVATDAGADLYSYDVSSGVLTDMTVDTNPADVATGAGIQQVFRATSDGSYVYFTATGDLAPGATPGHISLYVLHEGTIGFVADAGGLFVLPGEPCGCSVPRFYMTPDGRHVVFSSTASLTGYDNHDPVTGQPHAELFEANFGAGVVCVSCRVDGTRPTADTYVPRGGIAPAVVASDDGRRVFFQSSDAVVPAAGSGLSHVFEYEDGHVFAISRLDSSSKAIIFTASHSGDDVFFYTYDDPVPGPTAGDSAVFDARIGGGFPASVRHKCSPGACRTPVGPGPALTALASSSFSGLGNLAPPAPASAVKPAPKPLTRAQKLTKALKACRSKHDKRKRSVCEKSARKRYGRKK